MPLRIPPIVRSWVFWLLLALFALEFFLFDHFGARRFTPFYPRWHDQVLYLTESYTGFEFARSRGFVAGLLQALTNPSAHGTLHDFLTLFTFALSSPSRSAALSLNMLALIAWQAALFFAVMRTSGSRPLAFAVAVLPLALSGPWQNIPGSAYDFRLDHPAMCAIGLAAAAALLADGFYSRSGTTWFGVAAGLAILTRFQTGPYFGLIFIALALWIALGPPDRRTRGLNLLRAGWIMVLIAGPNLWLNFEAMANDYAIGTYFGKRSAFYQPEMGVGRSLGFVFESLGTRHLGLFFALVAVAGTLALALSRRSDRHRANTDSWAVGLIFFFAPAILLALHPLKSPLSSSALVPGVVLLALAAWSTGAQRAGNQARTVVAAAITIVVLVIFTRSQLVPAYTPAAMADLRQVNRLADQLQLRARHGGLREPKVAVDQVSDALDGRSLAVLAYERQQVWVPFESLLPAGVDAPAESAVMERLARSDFVILTTASPPDLYPFDQKMAALHPQLRAWCDAHLRAVDQFTFSGRRMVLYQRPEIPFP